MRKKENFENSIKKLEEIIQKLQQNDSTIDESLKLYEDGVESLKYCLEKLNSVEQKLVDISSSLVFEKKEKEPEFTLPNE